MTDLVKTTAADLAKQGVTDEAVIQVCERIEAQVQRLENPVATANAAFLADTYRRIVRQRGGSVWGANRCMVTVVRLERLLGEQLHPQGKERRGGGSRKAKDAFLSGGGAEKLPDGINLVISKRAKLLKEWGAQRLEAFVHAFDQCPTNLTALDAPKDLLSRGKVYNAAKEYIKALRKTELATEIKAQMPDAGAVHHGSFIDIAAEHLTDESVDLIFTDPPYHDATLPLYADLGHVAARVLKDGGSLITYTSHHRMPEVIEMLQAGGLTFFWPLAMVHTGQLARMTEYGIVVHWKPLLWFVKGQFRRRGDYMTFVNDLVMSQREKGTHPWQQSVIEARYYIEQLTKPDELVFDPFCGGGTTAIAAQQAGRQWLTCDIDEETVWIARQRIHDATNGVAA